jgi:hypothetical protein
MNELSTRIPSHHSILFKKGSTNKTDIFIHELLPIRYIIGGKSARQGWNSPQYKPFFQKFS